MRPSSWIGSPQNADFASGHGPGAEEPRSVDADETGDGTNEGGLAGPRPRSSATISPRSMLKPISCTAPAITGTERLCNPNHLDGCAQLSRCAPVSFARRPQRHTVTKQATSRDDSRVTGAARGPRLIVARLFQKRHR